MTLSHDTVLRRHLCFWWVCIYERGREVGNDGGRVASLDARPLLRKCLKVQPEAIKSVGAKFEQTAFLICSSRGNRNRTDKLHPAHTEGVV